MQVTFLGVGAAFDEQHTNISVLLETQDADILLDCGYSVPHAYWRHGCDVDAVYISHVHADHYFGLGPLLIRMKEEGRERPVHILTHACKRDAVEEIVDRAYPGSIDDAPFTVEYHALEGRTAFRGLDLSLAPTTHSVPNHAIRIEGSTTVCYSGDGEHTPESRAIYEDADFLIHEAFTVDSQVDNHSSIADVASITEEQAVERAAVVHVSRQERNAEAERFAEEKGLIMPEDGDAFTM